MHEGLNILILSFIATATFSEGGEGFFKQNVQSTFSVASLSMDGSPKGYSDLNNNFSISSS